MDGRTVRSFEVSSFLELRYIEVAPEVVVRGVYALRSIPENTMIEDCPVVPIYANEHTSRINAIRSYEYDWKVRDEHGNLVVTAALAAGMGGIYNHGDPGNITDIHFKNEFRMEFWTLRDIERGEELTHNYGWRQHAGTRLNPVDRYLRPMTRAQLAG